MLHQDAAGCREKDWNIEEVMGAPSKNTRGEINGERVDANFVVEFEFVSKMYWQFNKNNLSMEFYH